MEDSKRTYLQVLCERNRAPVYEDLAIESGGVIDSKFWKSKYNNYVVYDYEPFCADGFLIELNISFYSAEKAGFCKYLIDKRRGELDMLARMCGNNLLHESTVRAMQGKEVY